MAKAMFEVKKNDNGIWAVFNKTNQTEVAEAPNRDKARVAKKEFELAYLESLSTEEPIAEASTKSNTDITETVDPFENLGTLDPEATEAPAPISAPIAIPAKPRKVKTKVEQVEISDNESVKVVTASNYHSNMARAARIQKVYVDSYEEDKTFPSHRVMRQTFDVSYKALIRHRRTVKVKFLGLPADTEIPTGKCLPRTKKAEDPK